MAVEDSESVRAGVKIDRERLEVNRRAQEVQGHRITGNA